MKYLGSKNRIAKEILPIILKDRKPNQYYVEPFVGGANMIDKVDGLRIGGEYNKYIAEMWIALEKGWIPKNDYSKDDYFKVKNDKDLQPHLTGYIGINCSYSGKWFGGFAGKVETKQGLRDYQNEAFKNVMEQVPNIKGVEFIHSSYEDLLIPLNSIILCDPPYEGTTGYKDSFDNSKFWDWCREMSESRHKVFICEYNAPNDFECVWSKEIKSSLSANGKIGGNKLSVEKLFTFYAK
jgi:DNA adenine methylase